MFTIEKEFHFSASHQLAGLPEGHPCGRLHGHNYVVKLELERAWLDGVGFVRDYGELAAFKAWIDETVDHRHLNDIMDKNPTAENMAVWIWETWKPVYPELAEVSVSETPKTWATYYE
jgi:6-pyruvoyltetrahydropterin/6-carboxytetrahydropterin synthase